MESKLVTHQAALISRVQSLVTSLEWPRVTPGAPRVPGVSCQAFWFTAAATAATVA